MSLDTIQLDRLELTEGDNYFQEYTVVDDDDNPIDMTGSSGSFDAKVNLDDPASVWSMTMDVDPDQVANTGKISFTGVVPAKFEGKYTIRLVIASKTNTLVTGGSDILVLKSAYVAP
jgi:hypothetical protein